MKTTIFPSTDTPKLPRVSSYRISDNQPGTPTTAPSVVKPHLIPPDDKIPTASQYQRISNIKSTAYKPWYALATWVITEMDILINYDANAVINTITGEYEEYPALLRGPNVKIWTKSFANNLGRLSHGVDSIMLTGNITIFFINKNCVPQKKGNVWTGRRWNLAT